MRYGVALISLALCTLGCQSDAPRPKSETVDQQRPQSEAIPDSHAQEKAIAKPGVQDDGSIVSAVHWFEGTLEEALAEAKAQSKLVFIDVGAYWCPPCHRLDEEVFVNATVGEELRHGYVALHIDAEKGEGPEVVERYKVQAYPTLLVLEPTGVEKGRLVDFLEPEALLQALGRIAAGKNVLADLEADLESDPDDIEKRYRLGHAYVLAARRKEAEALFDDVLVADEKNELGFASKVLYDRALFFTFKLDRDAEKAIEDLKRLQRRYPDSKQATKAYRTIGRFLQSLGRCDDAIASLETMLAIDPQDVGLISSYGWFSFRQRCKPDAALKAVDRGLEANADDPELHYLRAELTHQLGDDAASVAAIRKASELEPKSAYYKRQVRRFEGLVGS